jgi:membrane protein DedA with SNARE-associated domain
VFLKANRARRGRTAWLGSIAFRWATCAYLWARCTGRSLVSAFEDTGIGPLIALRVQGGLGARGTSNRRPTVLRTERDAKCGIVQGGPGRLWHYGPMTSYFERLVDFVGAHPQLSFLAVFLLAVSEAVPVVGTVVPGSTLILAISALATTAGISPWALLVAAVVGAIAGDGFSFWLGHRYRRQILRGWPLNRFPGLIERSAQLIRKYGITSVFLARFTAVVRAFVPLLAGILRMSSSHFYVANILSALVWAPMHVFPGVLVGLAIAFGGAHAPQLSLAAVGVLMLAWIAWSMIRRKTAAVLECAASQQASGSDARKSSPQPALPADRTGQPDR